MQQEIWFQKYRIVKLLGTGGTAKVYLAEHILLNSYRAIKFISKNHPLYNLQQKEAKILKNLSHSSIPIIYDIEENEKGSYIVEEYLEGDTLKDYVRIKGLLLEDNIIRFSLQLCDLIKYLHSLERPILYLDLKPENIIVAGNTLKLIDFGSAIYLDELCNQKGLCGTKGFAAPELYHRGKIDERCDVYGIGKLIYFMVAGNSFKRELTYMDYSDLRKSCSKPMVRIINKCLKYNPTQRYASVTHLSKQLSVINKKKKFQNETSQSIRFAVAGAQTRIGTTHLSIRLCRYFIHQNIKSLYQENNTSRCVETIKKRYQGLRGDNGIYIINGIPMLPNERSTNEIPLNYPVIIKDFGCLTQSNIREFLEAEVKILILGAKDWELHHSEQVLQMVAEYKDIVYLFNYVDGKQLHQLMSSMDRRICYRIPYEPDPFKQPDINCQELFQEILGLTVF
ncbi:serine/threonine protein kinase [Mobilitalea sibirica]|uniref:Serine/threonine protein kinase n=1 Tax=Mobilitalea sibirica TaxID=1462919 RepID=A0A8J7H227_9FIRM|nr:serine/threonine-protein kinase [Mobilitalea sibirica]MBH1940709.1 serine/threonine protein kinase [Mobilitalea sibirica]